MRASVLILHPCIVEPQFEVSTFSFLPVVLRTSLEGKPTDNSAYLSKL